MLRNGEVGGYILTRVHDLRIGQRIDLENDPFADPTGDNPMLEFEYQTVADIERETDTCIAIGFEGFDVVGFPPDHLLRVVS